MSGVDAAATLSLRIDTDKAKKDIGELRAEYRQLRQELGSDLKVGTVGNQIKDLQASLSAVGAGVLSVNKALDDIVRAGGRFGNALSSGAKEAARDLASLRTSIAAGGGSLSGMLALNESQIATFNSRLKTVGIEAAKALESGITSSNFSKTNQVLSAFAKNTESSLNTIIRLSRDAQRALKEFGPETAKNQFGDYLVGGDAERLAESRLRDLAVAKELTRQQAIQAAGSRQLQSDQAAVYAELLRGDEQRARAQAKLNELNAKGTNDAARAKVLAAEKELARVSTPSLNRAFESATIENARRAVNARNSLYSDEYVAEQRAAQNLLNLKARTRAQLKIESDALLADAERAAKRLRDVALANERSVAYLASTPRQQASQNLRASIALDRGYSTAKFAPEAVSAATGLGSPEAALAAVRALESAHRRLPPAIREAAESQINWNKVAHEGHSAVRGLSGSLGTLWITYGSLVPLLTGAALGAAFKQTAVAGSEFAYQLTFVKALGGETSETVERLSDAAKSLGQNSLQGPVELASGFRVLAQAGIQGSDAILTMSSVLDLAVTGEMDMAQAGTTLVGVMKAFNLTVTSAGHVGDVFAKAAALSQTSVQAMTESMKTASVVGEQYGASLEDTATALTLLAKVNITGTAAGTSLRNMLKELYTPTKQAADTFAQLGLKTADASGNLKSFPDIIFELRTILEKYNKTSQVNILQRLFGERGAKEAIAMLAETRDSWDKLNAKISQSRGFIREVSAELEATTKGSFQQAMNALKVGFVDTFSKTEGPMKDMAIRLKTMFSSEEFRNGITSAVALLGNMASGLLSVASAVVSVANTLPQGTGTFIGMAVAAGGTTLALASLVSRLATAATSLSALGAAGLAALSPLSPLYIAVGALTAAYVLFNSKTPDTISSINSVNATLSTQITRLKQVNDELRKKIGLESTNASVEVSAVRRSIDSSKVRLAEYDSALKEDAESKRSGSTTVLGDMVRSVFSTDEEYRKKQAFLVEARVNRTALAKKIFQAELDLKVAEGYEDEIRKNTAKVLVKELLAQQELESRLKTGKNNFVPAEGGTKTGSGRGGIKEHRGELKDSRSIMNDNLASGLKQEQVQLARELLGIETQVAAQAITTADAIRQKNQATEDSIRAERLLIEASLAAAKAAADKVSIKKFENDLEENTIKLQKQKQQAILDNTKAYTAESNAIQDIGIATLRYIQDLEFERAALDMTAAQVANLRIEREALRATEDLDRKVSRKQIEPGEEAATRSSIELRAKAQKEDEEYRQSYVGGWKKSYKDWADSATDAAKQASDSFAIMSTAMDRGLTEFLTTGKLNFADFAKSVILDLAKIEIRALAVKATAGFGGFGGIISSILGMFGAGASGGGFSNSDFANLASSFIDNAKGNVFSGSPSLHQYVNTVQNTPKSFAFQTLHGFAKGGIFAEDGFEAVMPLARDNMGRLGVRAQKGESGSGKSVNIVVHVNGNSNAQDVRRSAGQGTREALAALNSARRYA